ncbi:hypothetical protein HK105_200665 [Polyrhizophydium stewartii]|uniref:Tail specific protease domain-containing protein n=1 Tax=Polyrhizophydium stewartii TaxID=2732419 RepID=A0ABR4NJP6_9FUNG|nr:hypothetical protein HK105_006794 [Polyrhizophydium stewartii]
MLLAAAAAVFTLASAASAQYAFDYLSNDRRSGRLTFVPLTPAEKNSLLTNAENLLTAWVNYDSKIANYGNNADPFPTLRDLRANIGQVSDRDLQIGLSQAFLSLRDLHTTFSKAGPYSCFYAATGVFFDFAEGAADIVNNPKVVVSGYSSLSGVQRLLFRQLSQINVGDELVAINGDPFATWFHNNQFQLAQNNRLYEVQIPYVSIRDNNCWAASSQLYLQRTRIRLQGMPLAQRLLAPKKSPTLHNDPIKNPLAYVIDKRLEPLATVRPVALTQTTLSSISWSIWDPQGKNMGIIYLTDFLARDSNGVSKVPLAIETIRSLLANELKDTKSVIVDIRDNGGGSISLANGLPQLFKADFDPFGARYLRNNVTFNIFARNNQLGQEWQDAWNEGQPADRYTRTKLFDTFDQVNTLGQAYVKPMGVFNNGRCYSACDMFSANIQDSATGTIFGEDGQTGAGGANVFDYSNFLALDPIDFTPLPLQELGESANSMRAGVRQSVRNGRNNGRLIEDLGITADFIFRPRVADLLPHANTSSQFDRIADKLREIGDRTGQNSLYFVAEPFNRIVNTGNITITAKVAGINEFTIQNSTGKAIGTVRPASLVKQDFNLTATAPRATLGNSQIVIIGKTGDKQMLKTKRNLRVVPLDADRIDLAKGAVAIRGIGKAVGIYNGPTTPDANGFNKVNNTWVLGDGNQYIDNTDSAIEVFLKAPVGSNVSISFDASYDTEKDSDFLTLLARHADGSVKQFLKTGDKDGVSGNGTISNKKFFFNTISSTFSIAARFTSDNSIEASGVTIKSFNISRVAV